jgi:hypothetical protein
MAMVGLVGVFVFAVETSTIAEQAEAKECKTSTAFNASKGRCLQP